MIRPTISGFGKEPKKLTDTYWSLLESHWGLGLATVDAEVRRRFQLSRPVQVLPTTRFAEEFVSQLRTCLKACRTTQHIDVRFVEAGALHVQYLFEAKENLLVIHENWLSAAHAVKELGIDEGSETGWVPDDEGLHVSAHASYALFEYLLMQFGKDDIVTDIVGKPLDWHRKKELMTVSQRLLTTQLMMRKLRLEPGPGSATLSWDFDMGSGWARVGDEIELHVHEADGCAHLRSLRLSRDGK